MFEQDIAKQSLATSPVTSMSLQALSTGEAVPESKVLAQIAQVIKSVDKELTSAKADAIHQPMAFVERKNVNDERLSALLEVPSRHNSWANRGPLWKALSECYESYFHNINGKRIVPCANGGIALEALARLKEVQAGKKLRWCVSAFGFLNTKRGYFSDAVVIDCDEMGLFSLSDLERLEHQSFDGIVVTNPFGLVRDFSAFTAWQQRTGKLLLIDNAAGVDLDVPNLPYQSFSLHHTKPYGFGEGGMALIPSDEYEQFLRLIEYQPLPGTEAPHWVNNGKISDLSCALHLMRLEQAPNWRPRYIEQVRRVRRVAESLGFTPLRQEEVPSMSVPLLAPHDIPSEALRNDTITLAKYYKPLANRTNCNALFDRIVNVPCHPDVELISDNQIEAVLSKLVGQ